MTQHTFQTVTITFQENKFYLHVNGSKESIVNISVEDAHRMIQELDMAWSDAENYWYIFK